MSLLAYCKLFLDSWWPGGVIAEDDPPRTAEQKLHTKLEAKTKLLGVINGIPALPISFCITLFLSLSFSITFLLTFSLSHFVSFFSLSLCEYSHLRVFLFLSFNQRT